MNDKYSLITEDAEKPEDVCNDGCIYKRDSSPEDEYCFKYFESMGSVECEVLWYYYNDKVIQYKSVFRESNQPLPETLHSHLTN